jgi:hypothetical protein
VTPLENLEKPIFGRSFKNRNQVITIPRILVKIVSKSLDLDIDSLTKEKLLEKLTLLPKNYKFQVLTALIEDEGTIDKNRVTIRMRDKKIMELLTQLIDSLGYPRSNLTKQKYKYLGDKKNIWKVDINIEGIKKYCIDLEKVEKSYGTLLSLWTKRESIKKLSTHQSNLEGYKRNKKLEAEILALGRFKNISFDSIKRQLNLTDNETMSILRFMLNKKCIERINRGVYRLKK